MRSSNARRWGMRFCSKPSRRRVGPSPSYASKALASKIGDWDLANMQTWSSDSYDRNARFVSELGSTALEWLDPKPGERILDVGCGDGELTLKIADRGARVVGVDT